MVLNSVILAVVLAQAATPRVTAPQTDQTVPVQKGARLSINNFAGEVIVRAWEKDAVQVVARHQTRTKVLVRQGPTGVSISATGTTGPQGSVDYEIKAPAWMPMRIEGTYNFITVEGAQGEVSANTVRGDIVIKGGSGVVTAKSVDGEVQVDGARGKINVSTQNEKIAISDTSGDISAESINGDITMTAIDSRSVDVSTVNGRVVFEGRIADGGHYSFGSHNGSLTLGLPDSVNATFTIRSYNGGFSSDLPFEGLDRKSLQRGRRMTASLGNGSADVNLETFGGAIRIRRGSASTRK